MIAPALHAEIRRLFYAEHWRIDTIATTLGVHHDTVRHAVESERFMRPGRQVRPSALDPYKAFIATTLEQYPRLRATRLWAMVRGRGYPGSVIQVQRYVRTVRPAARAEAYLRLDTLAGEQAQVDWGHFGKIRVGATTRLLSCFVLVLAWSRACYARFALDQTLESFLRGHVEAFVALQGVPRTILYDNLKSVVLERVGDHIRFHPRLLELAGHYHFAPQPCAVARGNEKGRVERFIGFLRHSFFAARAFTSVADLNAQLAHWIAEVAHARPVPDRREQSVAAAWAEEQPRLLPLPAHPFPCEALRAVSSGKTPSIRFDGNDYSIPHTLVRRPLTLVAAEHVVRLLDGTTEVARHARSYDRGQRIEDDAHLAALVAEKRRAHDLRGRDRLRHACPQAEAFVEALARRDHPLARETTHLLRLLDQVGAAALDAALADALARGAISAASVAHLLDQQRRARHLPPLVDLVLPADPRVRDLRVTPHASGPMTPCSPRCPHPTRRLPMAPPLAEQLTTLGLRYTAAHLDDVVALATKRRWSPTQLLEHLVDQEQQERTRRSLERRLARARIGRFTPMSDFDWAWPKRIDRAAVDAALRLDFLAEAHNVVLVAAQGLGKTMIAQNIAHAAVLAGTHVLFTTAAHLLLDLGGQESTRGLARRLNHYATRGLLVIDEIGYLSYDARAADLLFQVVSRRYERKSLVLTTNLPFSEWPTIFPNAATATALIDRLVHHAEILTMEGDSYRRRVAEAKRQLPRAAAGG